MMKIMISALVFLLCSLPPAAQAAAPCQTPCPPGIPCPLACVPAPMEGMMGKGGGMAMGQMPMGQTAAGQMPCGAMAMPCGGDCGNGPCGMTGGGCGPCGGCGPGGMMGRLSLSDKQAGDLKGIYRPVQKEAVGLAAKARLAEMDLTDLLEAEKADLKAVEGKLRELEAVRTQLRLLRIAAWQKAKAVLTPEQRKAIESVPASPCGKPCPQRRETGGSPKMRMPPGEAERFFQE